MSYQYGGTTKNEPTIILGKVKSRNGRNVARCGTNAGYGRHIRNRETPCDPCKDAHNAYMAKRRGGTTTGRRHGPATCGTYSGAQAHRRRNEPPCFPCAEAERTYTAELRHKLRAAGHKQTLTKPIEHGTDRGYQQHQRSGITPCAPCRAAHADAARTYRAALRQMLAYTLAPERQEGEAA